MAKLGPGNNFTAYICIHKRLALAICNIHACNKNQPDPEQNPQIHKSSAQQNKVRSVLEASCECPASVPGVFRGCLGSVPRVVECGFSAALPRKRFWQQGFESEVFLQSQKVGKQQNSTCPGVFLSFPVPNQAKSKEVQRFCFQIKQTSKTLINSHMSRKESTKLQTKPQLNIVIA